MGQNFFLLELPSPELPEIDQFGSSGTPRKLDLFLLFRCLTPTRRLSLSSKSMALPLGERASKTP